MENRFEIISYVGAKPLLFGMSEAQIETIIGSPLIKQVNQIGEGNAQYESFSLRYSPTDKRLVEIGFAKPSIVTYEGLELFQDAKAFTNLLKQDSCPHEYFGFIVLLDLGVTLTGFHDNDAEQLAVTVFAHGRWDHLRPKFRKFL